MSIRGSRSKGTPGACTRRGPANGKGLARSDQTGSVRIVAAPVCSRNVEWLTKVNASVPFGTACGSATACSCSTHAGHGRRTAVNCHRSSSRNDAAGGLAGVLIPAAVEAGRGHGHQCTRSACNERGRSAEARPAVAISMVRCGDAHAASDAEGRTARPYRAGSGGPRGALDARAGRARDRVGVPRPGRHPPRYPDTRARATPRGPASAGSCCSEASSGPFRASTSC